MFHLVPRFLCGRYKLVGVFTVLFVFSSASRSVAQSKQADCDVSLAPLGVLEGAGADRSSMACSTQKMSLTPGLRFLPTGRESSLVLTLSWLHLSRLEFGLGTQYLHYRIGSMHDYPRYAIGPTHLYVHRPSSIDVWGKPVMIGHRFVLQVPWSNSDNRYFSIVAYPSIVASVRVTSSVQLHIGASVTLRSAFLPKGVESQALLRSSLDLAWATYGKLVLLGGIRVDGVGKNGEIREQGRIGLRVNVFSSHFVEIAIAHVPRKKSTFVSLNYEIYSFQQKKNPKTPRLKDWHF